MTTKSHDKDNTPNNSRQGKNDTKKSVKFSPQKKSDSSLDIKTPSTNVTELHKHKYVPVDYDTEEISEFLDIVFHAVELEGDEQILCFKDSGTYHGYPLSDQKFLDGLERSKKPAKLYIGTSTVTMTAEGELRNRKDQFKRFHVVVLDDIGTKIPVEKIPKDFEPTYIVESSKGNFQYGYVLETPIDDYLIADTLISLVASAGVTDEGGKLVTKKVRCPQGVHGKKDSPDIMFRTKLVKSNGPNWTPQAILDTLNIHIKWHDVLRDADTIRKRTSRLAGAALYSGTQKDYITPDGFIDPVLEWLGTSRRIINHGTEWVAIECPNADAHSDGNPIAYYSPLGYGKAEYKNRRTFKCFHESCKALNTQDFFSYVIDRGGPQNLSTNDAVAELIASHVYDTISGKVWDIKNSFAPSASSFTAFERAYPLPVYIMTTNKKGDTESRRVQQHQLWAESPERVNVKGITSDPSTTARIIENGYGAQILNVFTAPEYGTGPSDPYYIDTFLEYMEYLIPDKEERENVLDWFAAKVQSHAFRGWGIIMVAKSQGTGRSMFGKIMTSVLDIRNCAGVPFKELTGDNNFNEWRSKSLIITNEASDDTNSGSFYSSYNQLKDLVDPMPQQYTLNKKNETKGMTEICYTTHLMLVNHSGNTRIAADDRRFYIVQNAPIPKSDDYLNKVGNILVDDKDKFNRSKAAEHLGRWLMARKVDTVFLTGPAPDTEMREEMIGASQSNFDVALETLFNNLPSCWVSFDHIQAILDPLGGRLGYDRMPDPKTTVRRAATEKTIKIPNLNNGPHRCKNLNGKLTRARSVLKGYENELVIKSMSSKIELSKVEKGDIKAYLEMIDLNAIRNAIIEELDLSGR